MSITATKVAITFPTRLISRLKNRAASEFGFDVPEMVRKLVADYVSSPSTEVDHLTADQEKKYLQDINEIQSAMKNGKTPVAHSLQELRQQIENDSSPPSVT